MNKLLDDMRIDSHKVKPIQKTMKANEVVIPHYDALQEDMDGNAIFPFNFLPAMADKLPDDYFIRTFP